MIKLHHEILRFKIILVSIEIALFLVMEPPSRNVDLWSNTDHGQISSTPQPPPKEVGVFVRLSIGDLIGRRVLLENLPWTPDHDPSEQIPETQLQREPNPVQTKNNVSVFVFLGIPYAEPPIDQRRFKPPQQISVLPGKPPFDATSLPASCPQDTESRPSLFVNDLYPYRISEDCLFLNLFTPSIRTPSVRASYPVIVFFHGGNFQTGSANDWPGHVLASRGLVVVVANYRLGPFGFLSLGDQYTGNYGIQDQRQVLIWVQQHIGAFGGDPQAVTIIGHDAGAVSAGIHMLSPLSRNLFRSVVAMSGADVSYHSTIGKPALAFNNTIKLGNYLGCVQPVASDLWNCILTRSTHDIVQAASPLTRIPIEYNRYLFMPTIDGKELVAHPFLLLDSVGQGLVNIFSVPYLTGMNAQDGVEVILEDRTLGEFTNFLQITHEYMRSFIIEYAFRHNYTMNREAIIEAIESYYTYWPDPSFVWKIREKFIELVTDAYYTAPIAQSAHLHSSTGSRTFFYVNNYNFSAQREFFANSHFDRKRPSEEQSNPHWMGQNADNSRVNQFSANPTTNNAKANFPSWAGTCHECDLYLLFGFPFMPSELLPVQLQPVQWLDIDRNASQLFSSFVRRFVKFSDPNLPADGTWPAHEPRTHWYLDFNYTAGQSLEMLGRAKKDYRYEQVAFWNNYLPLLVNFMTTTFPPSEVSVRRTLVTFQFVSGISFLILMLLLVVALSMGYNICTRNSTGSYEMPSERDIRTSRRRRKSREIPAFGQEALSTATDDTSFTTGAARFYERGRRMQQQHVSSF